MRRLSQLMTVALFGLIFGFAENAAAVAPNATFVAARTSGVAPLSVFFDAWNTTQQGKSDHEDFRDLQYSWNFGDAGAGNWPVYMPNGAIKPKNIAFGPEAHHVFETPGVYTVTLTADDGAGGVDTWAQQITVSDPASVFSGSNTICFSKVSDWTGCPTGADKRTNGDFDAADGGVMSFVAPGKRLLLHRGETWSGDKTSMFSSITGVTIGAYGSGPKPIIADTATSATLKLIAVTDWRIMDLEFRPTGASNQAKGIEFNGDPGSKQVLILRVDVTNSTGGGVETLLTATTKFHDQLSVVEGRYSLQVGSSYNLMWLHAEHYAVQGAEIGPSGSGVSHCVRIRRATPGVFQYNFVHGCDGSFIKLHAGYFEATGGNDGGPLLVGRYNERIVISDNYFYSDRHHTNNTWLGTISSQNDFTDERLRDIIVERNLWRGDTNDTTAFKFDASESVARYNIIDFRLNNLDNGIMIDVSRWNTGSSQPPASGVDVYNNTCYTGSSTGTNDQVCVAINHLNGAKAPTNTHVWNNLLYNPKALAALVTENNGTGNVIESNLKTTANPFIDLIGFAPNADRLGVATPWSLVDFYTNPASGRQLGAVEFGSVVAGGGGTTSTLRPAPLKIR